MKPLNFDALAIQKMASGHLCLNLTERINWEEFPIFADQFVRLLKGGILHKSDGPDLRIWEIKIEESALRLVFDDYPVMVSLESSDGPGDALIEKTHRSLFQ